MDKKEILSYLLRSRFFEEKLDEEFKKGSLYGTTHLSIGQEASHAGLSLALKKGDWIVPTHRCHGFNICYGSSLKSMFSEMMGSKNGLCKGLGGSMHMTDASHYNLGSSSVVASGVPLASGCAFSLKRQKKDNIAVAIFGDGASSRGAIHETMNIASVWKLPLLFFLENNHYGMSSSAERMISINSISSRLKGYNIEARVVDGNDFDEVYSATEEAREYILKNKRPFFIECNTYRLCGHSKSDKLLYRDRVEEEEWKKRDPILRYINQHSFTEEEVAMIAESVRREVEDAYLASYKTKDEVLTLSQALEYVIPRSEEFEIKKEERCGEKSYREAIRDALDIILASSERFTLIGEDIALYGGCFGVSGELYKKYPDRVIETPVSEEGFTGLAVGAAMTGERPIVEIMYGDFLTLSSDAIINHAAKAYFMSGGQLKCPIIIRTAIGGTTGHGAQHTQCLENMFLSVPGLKIVAPSDSLSAKALLLSAAKENCPVLFLEHKALYNSISSVSSDDYLLPLGKAIVHEGGKELLVVGYSRAFALSMEVLDREKCTFIDIATIKPLDEDTIKKYASSFSSLLIVQDCVLEGSIAESVIRIAMEVNKSIKIGVCASFTSPLAFSRPIEIATLPNKERIIREAEKLMGR